MDHGILGLKPYPLHGSIWRQVRKVHPGMFLKVYDHDGAALGEGYLFRYEARIALPPEVSPDRISWSRTIREAAKIVPSPMLPGTAIPIGNTRY